MTMRIQDAVTLRLKLQLAVTGEKRRDVARVLGVTPGAVTHRMTGLTRWSLSSHQLRHRYGTALYTDSHDLLVVQRLMRHSNPATTAGYALVADSVGARLVDRLPGL